MSWFASFAVAFLSGAIASVSAGLVAGLLVVDWYRISRFEGTADWFVVFIGLIGAVVGFITGLICARIVASGSAPSFGHGLLLSCQSLLGILAVGTMFTWLSAPPAPVYLPSTPAPVTTVPEVPVAPEPDEEAVFAALEPSAPLAVWLPYTRYGTPPERMARALTVLKDRPDLVAELAPLLHASDSTVQSDALRLLEHIPVTAAAPDVSGVGRELAQAIARFNATPPADDPRLTAAADISIRFAAWMVATRALRTAGTLAFKPELQAIADVARVRSDSHVMREDVLRVADHYLKEWT